MIALETTQNVPLTQTEEWTIRISGTRVNLEAVVYQYEQGETAEAIRESFPSLRLADIYAVISYYLNHREQVNDYLRDQERKAQAIRDDIESDPAYKSRVDELRERIKARYTSQYPAE
jgi:uncharacterized protein (DUF433 family)